MKHILLLGVCLTTSFYVNSQNAAAPLKKLQPPPSIANVGVRTGIKNFSVENDAVPAKGNTNPGSSKKTPAHFSTAGSIIQYPLGQTVYQLQTNYSTRNALYKKSDGTMAAVWTMSVTDPATDRGTGYSYSGNGGTSWSTPPSKRIEAQRTGWPNIIFNNSNGEVVLNHNTAVPNLELATRTAKGTGTWTENTTKLSGASQGGNVWPRMVIGGSNNNTLHVLSLVAPTGLGGVKFNKQNGALTYSRSQDGGATWDKKNTLIPDLDSLSGFNGFGADSYAIDARGNTVAYVVGTQVTDLVLKKSTDNGNTWTKKIILDFPVNNFNGQVIDVSNPKDGVGDTINVCDGSMAILLDNNDMAHVWFGNMRINNPTANDSGSYLYFPGTAGLMYWNEGMGTNPPVMIAGLEDIDNSGVIEFPTVTSGWAFGTFYTSLTGHPSAGITTDGKIYVVYDAVIENTNDGNNKAIRNVMVMGSVDGGATWSTPLRPITDDSFEQVFPSAARLVSGGCFSFLFQSDDAAGHGIGTSNPDAGANPPSKAADIYYNCITTNDITGVLEKNAPELSILNNYPNPFTGKTNIEFTLKKNSFVTIDVYNTIGQKILTTENKYLSAGTQTILLDATALRSGVYFYTLKTEGASITRKMIIE